MSTSILTKQLKALAKNIIVVDELTDQWLIDFRINTCMGCEKISENKETCTMCNCYVEVKAESLTNRVKKLREIQVTHCPLGKWGDEDIAREYHPENFN